MTISNILWLIVPFVIINTALGLSGQGPDADGSDGDSPVFEFVPPDKPVVPGIRLLDQTVERHHEHDIIRRETAGSGSSDLFEDNHAYYNKIVAINHPMSTFYSAEFDRIFSTYPTRSNLNLNNGKNLALTIPLKFPFDFYGHPVKTIVLTTSGFIYVNELTHPYLTFSQFIAPLMADFETNSAISSIKFVEIEDAFWVRWENLLVSNNFSLGTFSFQCAMFANGSIVFDYITIPISLEALRSASSVLKVGLSDAFYYDIRAPEIVVPTGAVLRKIVKYHELTVPWDHVVTDGIIHLVHLPTCNQQSSCSSCTDRGRVPAFNCSWCYELGRCSSGVDRRLQEWHDSECHYTTGGACTGSDGRPMGRRGAVDAQLADERGRRIVLGVCLGLLGLAVAACLAGVLLYGHRHPGSRIGAWLIEHRLSRYRERFFGSSGASGGGSGESYKVSSDNTYVNFSNT